MRGADLATFADQATSVIQTYFDAWQHHDVAALDRVFAPNASYEITGKATYRTLPQIRAYWQRNALRQKNVVIQHDHCPVEATKICFVRFLVTFEDVQLAANVTISGTARFKFDENGLCTELSEGYYKQVERRLSLTMKDYAGRYIIKPVRAGRQRLAVIGKTIAALSRRMAYPVFLGFAMLSFAFALYMNFVEGLFVTYISDQQMITRLNRIANSAFIVSAFVLFIKDHYRRSPNDILQRHRIYAGEHTDLKIMRDELNNASDVTIYSGDFSFIATYPPLQDTLRQLADRGNLTLISYKPEIAVRGAAATTAHIHILDELQKRGRLHFDSPDDAKYSVVTRPGTKSLLFRFEDGDGSSYVGVIAANSNVSRALLDTVGAVTRSIAAKL